jgi:hypothetical protein
MKSLKPPAFAGAHAQKRSSRCHEQGGGDPVAGDVADDDRKAWPPAGQVIEIIAPVSSQ